MPTYNNITTTNLQDKALDWLVRVENARRAALIPPLGAITKQQYIDVGMVGNVLDSYLAQYGERVAELVKEKYLAASGSIQGQVRTLLGVNPDTDL